MDREIHSHIVKPGGNNVTALAVGEPGIGGQCNHYEIGYGVSKGGIRLDFETAPGTPGLTMEVLLAVIIDRLTGFQDGPTACDENAMALTHARSAMRSLHGRTMRLMGTAKPVG